MADPPTTALSTLGSASPSKQLKTTSDLAILTETLPFLHLSPTNEIYQPLPPPHRNIILTGPRPRASSDDDVDAIVAAFNDPAIYTWTVGPPYPYLPEHAQDLLSKTAKVYSTTIRRMCQLAESGEELVLDQTPLRFIREVQGADGGWTFVGDVGLERCTFLEVGELEERARLVRENEARRVGDEEIVWMIAEYLVSSHHGKGIMTHCILTLLQTWAIPLLHARTIRAYVLTGNDASRRVFQKLGFGLVCTREGGVPMQGKRDWEAGVWVMEWRYAQTGEREVEGIRSSFGL